MLNKKKLTEKEKRKPSAFIDEKKLILTLSNRDYKIDYNPKLDPTNYPRYPLLQHYIKFGQWNSVLVNSKHFNNLIISCILMAAVIVGIQTYTEDEDTNQTYPQVFVDIVTVLDTIILYIFTFEVAFKIFAEGTGPWNYFVGPEYAWNNFDVIIVVLCYLPLGGNASSARLLRLFRLMRVAKIVRKIPQLQMIIMGLIGGMKSIVYIMILLFLVFYLYAIAGIIFFSANDPWHYGNLWNALVTLFRCATMEDWTEVMYINIFGCDVYPNIYVSPNTSSITGGAMDDEFYCTDPGTNFTLSILFHVSFIIISALVMMSLFVGAVTMSMTESMDAMKEEAEELQKERRLQKGRRIAEQLRAQESQAQESQKGPETLGPEQDGFQSTGPDNKNPQVTKGKINEDINHNSRQGSSKRGSGSEKKVEHTKRAREQRRLQHLMMKAWMGMDMTDDGDDEIPYTHPLKRQYAKGSLFCRRIAESYQFQNFITIVILLAGAIVGIQTAEEHLTSSEVAFVNNLDTAILAVFTAEVGLKLIAEEFEPWMYFTDGWNIFDFLIVMASQPYSTGTGEIVAMFRLLRLLRVLKLVKALPQLQVIVTALIMGLNSIGFIAIIISIFFYFFAIIGMLLFSYNDPWHFGSLHITMFTLFRCATLEDWTDVMYINMYGCHQYGYDEWPEKCKNPSQNFFISVCYFFVFIIIGALVLFSLFIGVVTTSMEEATAEMKTNQEVNEKVDQLQEKYSLSDSCVAMYREVFKMFDMDGSGTIEEEELGIGLRLIGKRPEEAELQELIRRVDKDNSGEIDFSEFLEFMIITREKMNEGKEKKNTTKRNSMLRRGSLGISFGGRRNTMMGIKRKKSRSTSSGRSTNSGRIVPVDSEEPRLSPMHEVSPSREDSPANGYAPGNYNHKHYADASAEYRDKAYTKPDQRAEAEMHRNNAYHREESADRTEQNAGQSSRERPNSARRIRSRVSSAEKYSVEKYL